MNNIKFSQVSLATFLVITLVYTLLFFPQVFVANEDIKLATAFEVDPGSILQSITALYEKPYYSMMNGFHSKFYGWTFYSICFVLTLPYVVFTKLISIYSIEVFHIAIRFIHFLLGLFFLYALNYLFVIRKSTVHLVLGLTICSMIMFSKYSYIFYFLHPESTGAFFVCLTFAFFAAKCNSFKQTDIRILYVLIALAALSKQVFAIALFPFLIYLCIIRFNMLKQDNKFPSFFIFELTFIFIFVFALINPYALIKPHLFIGHQLELSTSFTVNSNLSFFDSLQRWISVAKADTLIFTTLLISWLQFGFLFIKKFRVRIYIVSTLIIPASIYLLFFLIVNSNRTLITHHYLFPIFVLCCINVAFFIVNFRNLGISFMNVFISSLLSYICIFFLIANYQTTLGALNERLDYKNSISYKSYDYIRLNIPLGSRIAHDHFVAIPSEHSSNSCHYWAGCGTDYIYKFSPDYIIYNPSYDIGMSTEARDKLTEFIQRNNFKKITTINSTQGNIVDSEYLNTKNVTVDIYSK